MLQKLWKKDPLLFIINTILLVISVYSFCVPIDYTTFLILGGIALVVVIFNIIFLVKHKRNDEEIMGDILALIGSGLYLLLGPIVGLVCAVFLLFSFIFKVKYIK